MMATPAQARETWPCPISRTFKDKQGPNCIADHCPLWRWKDLMVTPEYNAVVSAVADKMAQAEGKTKHIGHTREANRTVMADRKAHGLPDKPFEGWCGLGGTTK